MSSGRWWRSPLPWLGGLLVLYLLSPIAAFVGRLTTTSHLASPGTTSALLVSAETATIATAVIAVLGVPLAYLLAQGRSRTSTAMGVALALPIALPPLMSGILLLYLVGPYTTLGRLFGGRLTDDRIGIVLAQIFVAAPFLVVVARAAFSQVDASLAEVAATLGHRRWARFVRVAVPTAIPGIAAGLLLAWLRAFGEFGATVILAYHPYSLPVFTYVQFGSSGLTTTMLPVAAALGASLVVLVVTAVLTRRLPLRVRCPATTTPRPPVPAPALPLSFDLSGAAGSFGVHACGGPAGSIAIIGETGAGKTLTVRMLAGLLGPDRGSVRLGDHELGRLATETRGIGYLPQDSTLLAHLPVRRQIGFGADTDPQVAAYWIDWLGLAPLAERRPDELSGGQRRKTAIARALAREPRLLLLDEPFSGLDTTSRVELRHDLRRLRRQTPITTVIVTHDPEDVALLADDVLVLHNGATLQYGRLDEVYDAPASPTIARLLGIPNTLAVRVVDDRTVRSTDGTLLPANARGLRPDTAATALFNQAQIAIGTSDGVAGVVTDVVRRPDHHDVEVSAGTATTLRLVLYRGAAVPAVGSPVNLTIDPASVRVAPVHD
jgi:molybdate transport system permease protein